MNGSSEIHWQLTTMLPVHVIISGGRTILLTCRPESSHGEEAVVFEMIESGTGAVIWALSRDSKAEALRAWNDGIQVQDGSAEAEVFEVLETKQLAKRL